MTDPVARFWAKVNTSGDCWLWTASVDGNGYGRFRALNVEYKAHVWAWEHENGPKPAGMDLDHLCGVRACVRASHLEPVTHRENLLRSPDTLTSKAAAATECPKGHPYDAENTYISTQGFRLCRICRREAARRMTLARRKANRVPGQKPSIRMTAPAQNGTPPAETTPARTTS